jgi:hypothetical protein
MIKRRSTGCSWSENKNSLRSVRTADSGARRRVLPGRLPVPWQKLIKALDGTVGGLGEHIGQPSLWIHVVHLCRLFRSYAERFRNDAPLSRNFRT